MSSWAEQQRQFACALLDSGLPAPETVGRAPAGDAGRPFDVYRNNRVVVLVDALKSTFPAVHRLVGEDYFLAAAKAYIHVYPPGGPVLLLYGGHFGDFLDGFPSASGVPYLGDVARLEWARMRALHAKDAVPAGIERLAAVPGARLQVTTLGLHPSLSVVASRWPVVSLWAAGIDPDNAKDMDMGKAEDAVVLRPELRVDVLALPPAVGALLAALQAGAFLGEAAQRAMDAEPDFDLAGALELIFRIGAVTHVDCTHEYD